MTTKTICVTNSPKPPPEPGPDLPPPSRPLPGTPKPGDPPGPPRPGDPPPSEPKPGSPGPVRPQSLATLLLLLALRAAGKHVATVVSNPFVGAAGVW